MDHYQVIWFLPRDTCAYAMVRPSHVSSKTVESIVKQSKLLSSLGTLSAVHTTELEVPRLLGGVR